MYFLPNEIGRGVVLNGDLEVVGIIKGGVVTLSKDDANENQGFVPIHSVIDNLSSKKIDYSLVEKGDREDENLFTFPAKGCGLSSDGPLLMAHNKLGFLVGV